MTAVKAPCRPYQTAAVGVAIDRFSSGVPSGLVELPTGTGKTRLSAEVIGWTLAAGKRALFIAHRNTLVKQGAREIGRFLGRQVGVWCGEEQASLHAPVLSASKDSLTPKNLSRLDAAEFGVLVCDECHHATNSNTSYRRVFDWAAEAGVPRLGITATPDRSDGVTLVGEGKPFAELFYRYPMWDPDGGPSAISDGWLVPVRQDHLHVDGLDFSAIKKKKNWTDEDIEAVLAKEQTQLELASSTVDHCEGRPTVVFCPTVAFAYKMSELIDRYAGRPVSVVIHGQHKQHPITKDDRRNRDRMFQEGERQFAISVDALAEGWDAPRASCVAVMRPVKSRLRFAQMVGRGTRLSLGLPNEQVLAMTAAERRAAIAASAKPDCLVLGFYSNLADLKLWVNAADVIGAGLPEEVRRRANKLKSGDTTQRLLKAKEQVEAEQAFASWEAEETRRLNAERLQMFTPKAMVRRTSVDVYGEDRSRYEADHTQEVEAFRFRTSKAVSRDQRPSVNQARFAVALGLSPEHCIGMTRKQVGGFISKAKAAGTQPDWARLKPAQMKFSLGWYFTDQGRERHDTERTSA